jgi:hypothetical protein
MAEPAKEKLCTPDANVFCRCDDRSEGTKKCGSDGRTFSDCVCSAQATKPTSKATSPKDTPDPTQQSSDDKKSTTRAPTTGTDPTPVPVPDPKPSPGSSSGTSPDPVPTDPPPPPAPPPLGTDCKDLQTCCGQLKAAGYQDDTCLGVVDARNETGCYNTHKNYKDYGDCT